MYICMEEEPEPFDAMARMLSIQSHMKVAWPTTLSHFFFIFPWFSYIGLYKRNQLVQGQTIRGPAIIEQMDSTAIIFPEDSGKIDNWGNLIISTNG